VIASYGAAPPLFRLARISGDARRTGTRTAAVGPRPRHPTGSRALRECHNSLGDLGSERASTTRPLEEGNNRPPARAANEKARERRAGHCESGEILAAPVVTNATSSAGAEGTTEGRPAAIHGGAGVDDARACRWPKRCCSVSWPGWAVVLLPHRCTARWHHRALLASRNLAAPALLGGIRCHTNPRSRIDSHHRVSPTGTSRDRARRLRCVGARRWRGVDGARRRFERVRTTGPAQGSEAPYPGGGPTPASREDLWAWARRASEGDGGAAGDSRDAARSTMQQVFRRRAAGCRRIHARLVLLITAAARQHLAERERDAARVCVLVLHVFSLFLPRPPPRCARASSARSAPPAAAAAALAAASLVAPSAAPLYSFPLPP